ncbi:MAG: acyltransferase [Geobacter sp.]|nr:MAG: acyltransferase [Geobacter sp.]
MTLYSGINLFFIRLFTLLVPRCLHPPFAFVTGGLFYLVSRPQRRGIRANLQVITGRKKVERLVFSTFYKYARNWSDVMLMMGLHGADLFSLIGKRKGEEHLQAALAGGNGAILISLHLGNWELGGLGLAELGYTLNVLTFREEDESVNSLREEVRAARGIRFIYVERNDASPLAVIEAVNALRRNEVLALLGDRDGSSHTVTCDFFGLPAEIPVGAVYLALVTGAPVIPVFVPLEGGRYTTVMEEPVYFSRAHDHATTIRTGTEQLLRVFERYLRKYPDQWYNLYDYWRESRFTPEKGKLKPEII